MEAEGRLFAALDGKQLETPPSISISLDPNVVNQALGKKPSRLMDLLDSPMGSSVVDRHSDLFNRFCDQALFLMSNTCIHANYEMGFDAVWFVFWRMKIRDHAHLYDMFGRRMDIVDDGYGNAYLMYGEGLIKSPDEWRVWPRPDIAEYARATARMYRLLRAIWRRRIAVIPFIGPGPWENSWQPMGFAPFVKLLRRDPAFVREVVGYFTALMVASVDACCSAGARVITIGEDLAYKSGPMLSPDTLEKFYGESYRQITATAHRHGAKIAIHCCGNTEDLLERFVEWGFDGAHAFEPSAGNDLARARQKVGDRLCMIGNIDVTETLVSGTREEVEAEVAAAIRDSRGGGFILTPAHTHAGMSVERIKWMLEAGRRTG
jgi:Uroporphyrinogen decarboxylase (URO-D)